jgi:ketopantoate reductase
MVSRRLPTLVWRGGRAFYRNIPGTRLRPIPTMATQFDKIVYILGLGSLGKLIAHSLRKSFPHLPITIIFRRWSSASEWQRSGGQIELITNGKSDFQGPFEYEVQEEPQAIKRLDIRNLIVATKTYDTRGAVATYVGRLSPASSVLFLQNGMGEYFNIILHSITF